MPLRIGGPSASPRAVLSLILLLAASAHAQGNNQPPKITNLPNLSTIAEPSGKPSSSSVAASSSAALSSATSDSGKVTNAPQLTTQSSATATSSQSIFRLTGLPTLAGAGIPTVVVPNTQHAPYMQKSSYPEGTVFIAVGAVLGFMGVAVLMWRVFAVWALHRSVKRSALVQGEYSDKPLGRSPGGAVYQHANASSTLSLDALNSPNLSKGEKTHSIYRPGTSGGNKQNPSSLFFSPTAGAGVHSTTNLTSNLTNRSSSYLPAGYYAPGASIPAAGQSTTQIGGLPGVFATGPAASGYTRARSIGTSPPASPSLAPSHGGFSDVPIGRNSSSRGNDTNSFYGGSGYARNSMHGGQGLYSQTSNSTLNLNGPLSHLHGSGQSVSGRRNASGSTGGLTLDAPHQERAPSAYLEDLFENHGSGPRTRF
jgi:hypothetical protein